MNFAFVFLFFVSFLALGNVQEGLSGKQAVSPPIGLEVGHRAPSFTLRDQFGREQSIENLRGTNGTVLLFVRSADW
jgi:hypothetical protein